MIKAFIQIKKRLFDTRPLVLAALAPLVSMIILGTILSCAQDAETTEPFTPQKTYYPYAPDDYPLEYAPDTDSKLFLFWNCAQDSPLSDSNLKAQMLNDETLINQALKKSENARQKDPSLPYMAAISLLGDSKNITLKRLYGGTLPDENFSVGWLGYSSGPLAGYPRSMGSGDFLEDFLFWIATHFDFNDIILVISDHGIGPYNERLQYKSGRAICVTTGYEKNSNYLSSSDIATAIRKSGLKEKIRLLIFNACLQGSIETIFNLAGEVDYVIASPNSSYNIRADWIIDAWGGATSIEDAGKNIIDSYYDAYKDLAIYRSYNQKEVNGSYNLTLTLTDTRSEENFKNIAFAVNELKSTFSYNSKTKETARKFLSNSDNGFCYTASTSYLKDLGLLASNVIKDSNTTASMKSSSETLLSALKSVIVYGRVFHGTTAQWVTSPSNEAIRGSKTIAGLNLIYEKGDTSESPFGIAINSSFYKKMNQNYSYYSNFGYISGWGDLLMQLYPMGAEPID